MATVPDDNMLKTVHQSLKDHDLLPAEHLVDKGYTDARVLADNPRDYGVTIVGPVADDPSWQARSGEGFDKSAFAVDWDRQIVTCPGDKQSISWLPNTYPKNGAVFEARFPPRIVRLVRCGPSAPKPSESPASLDCNRVSIMRRCKPPDSIKRRKISNKATPHAQALREHMNRRSVAADCGDAAISGSRRHACSMSPPPSQSIWSGWTRGGPALQEQKRDAPTSRPCGGPPRVIANSPPVSKLGSSHEGLDVGRFFAPSCLGPPKPYSGHLKRSRYILASPCVHTRTRRVGA